MTRASLHNFDVQMPKVTRAAKPAEVCCDKCWWNLIWNLAWNLKSPMGKIWWNLGGGLFYLPGKHENFGANFRANFGANFGENFGDFVSSFATFFGNFVQQKSGAKKIFGFPIECSFLCPKSTGGGHMASKALNLRLGTRWPFAGVSRALRARNPEKVWKKSPGASVGVWKKSWKGPDSRKTFSRLFQTFSGFRARETPVNGQRAPKPKRRETEDMGIQIKIWYANPTSMPCVLFSLMVGVVSKNLSSWVPASGLHQISILQAAAGP